MTKNCFLSLPIRYLGGSSVFAMAIALSAQDAKSFHPEQSTSSEPIEIRISPEPKAEQRPDVKGPTGVPLPLPPSPAPATRAPKKPKTLLVKPRNLSRMASPKGVGRWSKRILENMPSQAIREGLEGTVKFEVTVGLNGRIYACNIVETSGHSILDVALCKGMSRFSRFNAALDNQGDPTFGTYSAQFTYRTPPPLARPTGNKDGDIAGEAQSAFEAYVGAINRGDVDAAADFYDAGSKTFHWIERGAVQYDSAEAAAASLRSLNGAGSTSRMEVDELHVTALDERSAFVSGHFHFVMLDASGGGAFSFDGWMSVAMIKRASGWKIAAGQTGPGKSAQEGQ